MDLIDHIVIMTMTSLAITIIVSEQQFEVFVLNFKLWSLPPHLGWYILP